MKLEIDFTHRKFKDCFYILVYLMLTDSKPVVKILWPSDIHTTFESLIPWWELHCNAASLVRGSITLKILSLHCVAIKWPFHCQLTPWISSSCPYKTCCVMFYLDYYLSIFRIKSWLDFEWEWFNYLHRMSRVAGLQWCPITSKYHVN